MKGVFALALAFILLPAGAVAQQAEPGRFHVAATIGRTEYDLAGVGKTDIFSGRAGLRLNRFLGMEAQLGYASLAEDAGNSALYFPEAQLQVRWPGLRVSPYLGAGAGMIVADSYDPVVATDTDITFSSAGGVSVDLFGGMLLIGEVRVRGVGRRFTGSTGDFNLAVGYRF